MPVNPNSLYSQGQDELFSVSLVPSGLTEGLGYTVRSQFGEANTTPEPEEPATPEITSVADTRQRAGFLLESLSCLASVSRAQGFNKAIMSEHRRNEIQAATPFFKGLEAGIKFKQPRDMQRARQSFLNAYNLGRATPADNTDVYFNDAFTEFNYLYGAGSNPVDTERRSSNRSLLRKSLEVVLKVQESQIR